MHSEVDHEQIEDDLAFDAFNFFSTIK